MTFVVRPHLVQAEVIHNCGAFVAQHGGRLAVGINDSQPKANLGTIDFAVEVRNPTVEEWLHPDRPIPCLSTQPISADRQWRPDSLRTVQSFFAGPAGLKVAQSIQRITHPTGNSPALGTVDAKVSGDRMAVRIPVDWRGGLIGTHYKTVVVWDFYPDHHNEAVVRAENAAVPTGAAQLKELDEFFRAKVFPAVWGRERR